MAAGDVLEFVIQPDERMTHTRQTVTLDGSRYTFDFYTDKADGGWYMDVSNDEGEPQVQGIRIVTGVELLYRFRYLQVPPGDLFVNSTLSTPADPDLTTWQRGEAKLYYMTTT